MPGLNWAEVDAATVACFSTEFLQTELIRRGIDATGSRDDLIQRLTACLEEARAATLKAPRRASAPVSSTRVQFPASPLTLTVCQAIPGQSLRKAVCFKCHEKGHLASKCPTKQENVTQQPAIASTSLHAAAPALPTSPLEDVHGSHLECSFFTADIALLGSHDAVLDTGSKITIVTKSAIKNLPLMPWTREPLAIVGGSSAYPKARSA
ncbi:hypothetical protein HPB49_013212 [Dermacentor silvarum]|uniref:Uncharacterized protein n=1 Tax=Dermacentor silvarum TaxID=543639 RepID=A0ACB8C9N2_DERSI|nr:hypothetical protein HPB49_013212 [Dermacentor silvarum]